MWLRKITSLTLALLITMQFAGLQFYIQPVKAEEEINKSRMLKTHGNRIVFEDDETVEVVLRGVNVPGGEWTATPDVERVMRSTQEAMHNWNCNVIRLGVSTKGWYGEQMGNYTPTDGGAAYRKYYDDVINEISKAGKYVILDLHEYGIFYQKQLDFWLEAAEKYKNNPTVLFGILNEPSGSASGSWALWRNGGSGGRIGHQTVVERIRDLGARNIIVAGGRNYSNDLRGIVGQAGDGILYALIDQGTGGNLSKKGNGIMYDLHMYAWHGGVDAWERNAGEVRRQYPILMGEFGWDEGLNQSLGNKYFPPGHQQYHDKWMPEVFEWMNDVDRYGNYANWTAYSFHPSSSPVMIERDGFKDESYAYPPTEHFGIYVKNELMNSLSKNVVFNKPAVSTYAPAENPPSAALDGNKDTFWFSLVVGEKYLEVDLGANFNINRWVVTHSPSPTTRTTDFKLQASMDGAVWTDIDTVTNNVVVKTDRYIRPTLARYVRISISKGTPAGGNSARLYEFVLLGKDASGTASIIPPSNTDGDALMITKQERDFTKGDTLDDWGSIGDSGAMIRTYPIGEAEDGISPVLRISGGTNPAQYKIFGLTSGAFNDFRDVEKWHIRMRSTADLSIKFIAHWRVSNEQKTTNSILLPSTNGQWKDFYFNIEDLKPTTQDTWVNEMRTIYNTTYKNYEPIVQFIVQGALDDKYIDFSKIRSIQKQNYNFNISSLEFTNGGIVTNNGLRTGKTDVAVRLLNSGTNYQNHIILLAGLYQKSNSKLVAISTKTISLPPGVQSQEHQVSVTIPNGGNVGDYYVKVSVWHDAYNISSITNTIILDDNGVIQ